MKRFLVIIPAGQQKRHEELVAAGDPASSSPPHEPFTGGWFDWYDSFDTVEEAVSKVQALAADKWQIVDVVFGIYVRGSW